MSVILIMFVCRMMKNQRKLEEEQSVTVKIIQSKDQEISLLKSRLVNEFEDDGLGLLLAAGRDLVRNNCCSLLNYLVRQPQAEDQTINTSWALLANKIISLPTRILSAVLSHIL